ncbi:alpha/beta fold hydrolase [Ramlibacter terrae]|uniref:Alpha/beta fold hydrolase n=1 Tax=Ramlibacter terrae TaxID=2732511 RepID=A0ABX6P2Z8_9BURK|nr:alpha/beta fold hydrolase [Ramlibacter terrae]
MPFAASGSRNIYYERHGAGPAVLFIHGAGSNAATWWQQLPAFGERHTCITMDVRCFGRSVAPLDEFALHLFVQDVLAILDQKKDRPRGDRRPVARRHDRPAAGIAPSRPRIGLRRLRHLAGHRPSGAAGHHRETATHPPRRDDRAALAGPLVPRSTSPPRRRSTRRSTTSTRARTASPRPTGARRWPPHWRRSTCCRGPRWPTSAAPRSCWWAAKTRSCRRP